MDLRRLRCVGPCACGGALVVLMVPPLRFILASQAGLVIGWRTAAMPSNILTLEAASAVARITHEYSGIWRPREALEPLRPRLAAGSAQLASCGGASGAFISAWAGLQLHLLFRLAA